MLKFFFSVLLAVIFLVLYFPGEVRAQSKVNDESKINDPGPIQSDQALALGDESSGSLRAQAEVVLHRGDYGRGIELLEKSVQLNPQDLETRSIYAKALEDKYVGEGKCDPKLYNRSVKEWMYVVRKAEFPDQSSMAMEQLAQLTGVRPHIWTIPSFYYKQVLLPEPAADDKKAPNLK